MKREVEIKTNDNGSYTEKVTITQTPEDGFVPDSIMRPYSRHTRGKSHKGYGKTVIYTTNDTRVTRPAVYGMCGLLLIIGIILLLFHVWLIGFPFIGMALIVFFSSKKQIDTVAEELEENGQNIAADQREE